MKYRFAIFLIIITLMLSLYAWNPKICFNPDELFYFKSCQGITDLKSVFAPEYFGEHRFQKPPLFYLFVAFFFKLFGVNWFAARMVSIIASVLVLLFTYLLGRKMFDEEAAFYASGVLATTMLFFRFGRIVLPEMTFIFFMAAAFYFAWRAFSEERPKLFIISFCFMGVGTLVKGPVGFILPYATLLAYSVVNRKNLPCKFPWLEGLLINLVFVLLWIAPVVTIFGSEFSDHLWGVEVTQRIVEDTSFSSIWAYAWHKLIKFLFYVPIIIAQFLPWSAILAVFFIFGRKDLKKGASRDERLFLITWAAAGFLLFSLVPAKRHHYVLCYFPAIALYCVSFFDLSRAGIKKAFKSVLALVIAGYFVLSVVVFPVAFTDGVDKLSAQLKRMLIKEDAPVAVSWRLDPQEIELYLDKPVIVIDEFAFTHTDVAAKRMKEVKNVFYFVIAEEEFGGFFEPFVVSLRDEMEKHFVWTKLAENWRWRKTIKFPEFYRNMITNPGGVKDHFNSAFREQVYVLIVRGT